MISHVMAMARRLPSSLRKKGISETLKRCKATIEEIWFDFKFGVDTLETVSPALRSARPDLLPYAPTKISRLKAIIQDLPIDYTDFTLLDLGSGKGRVLLMASEFPFRRVVGVEILPELHAIARKNIQQYHSATQKSRAIVSVCSDAVTYRLPAEDTILFLCNPFHSEHLKHLLANLRESLKNHPRQLYIVYHNPMCHAVMLSCGFLDVVNKTALYILYKANGLAQQATISPDMRVETGRTA
jgi:SAM-dependent methyltransferase